MLDVLAPIAEEKKVSIAQLALAWLLHQPVVSSVIIGATKLHQLQDNLNAITISFTEDELHQLNEVSKLPGEYPGIVLEIMTADRSTGVDFLNT